MKYPNDEFPIRMDSHGAAAFLGCSYHTLKVSRSTGTLFGRPTPTYRKLSRKVVYDRAELEAWIEQFGTRHHTAERS